MRHESGRTLVEMLGTLAIMGILSIVGLAGYHYALKTTKANNVLYDARTIYALMLGHQNPQSGTWLENTDIQTITPYKFYQIYDKNLKPFIKVVGIEKGVCQRMLQMSSDAVSFLTSNNESLTMCVDENDIVVNFNVEGKMTTCTTQSDCLEEGSVCLSGQCTNCIAPKIPHENGTECVCVEGYRGDLCDTCAENYIMNEDECIRCPNGTGTNTEEYLGNALTDDFVGCYCKNVDEGWNSSEQKCDVSQYQELEYICSDKNSIAYIDTGLKAQTNTKIEIISRIVEQNASSAYLNMWHSFYGASTDYAWTINKEQQLDSYQYGSWDDIPATVDLLKHTLVQDGKKFYRDGLLVYTSSRSLTQSSQNIFLFARRSSNGGYTECYGCKIWDNNTLVRDFIPAIRKSDNVAGMWDNVSKTFFENKGSGIFITGLEVPNTHIQE